MNFCPYARFLVLFTFRHVKNLPHPIAFHFCCICLW